MDVRSIDYHNGARWYGSLISSAMTLVTVLCMCSFQYTPGLVNSSDIALFRISVSDHGTRPNVKACRNQIVRGDEPISLSSDSDRTTVRFEQV